jgi:flagellar biosynthesis regulator FlbT
MKKKAEIIKKDVILITLKRGVYSIDDNLTIEEFTECRFLGENHCIQKDGFNYYCKGNEYYVCDKYCFIVNLSRKDEALKKFFEGLQNVLIKREYEHKKQLGIIKDLKEITGLVEKSIKL